MDLLKLAYLILFISGLYCLYKRLKGYGLESFNARPGGAFRLLTYPITSIIKNPSSTEKTRLLLAGFILASVGGILFS